MKGGWILLSFEIGSNFTEINGAPQHKMDVKEKAWPTGYKLNVNEI